MSRIQVGRRKREKKVIRKRWGSLHVEDVDSHNCETNVTYFFLLGGWSAGLLFGVVICVFAWFALFFFWHILCISIAFVRMHFYNHTIYCRFYKSTHVYKWYGRVYDILENCANVVEVYCISNGRQKKHTQETTTTTTNTTTTILHRTYERIRIVSVLALSLSVSFDWARRFAACHSQLFIILPLLLFICDVCVAVSVWICVALYFWWILFSFFCFGDIIHMYYIMIIIVFGLTCIQGVWLGIYRASPAYRGGF